jgi:hypothetical protein
MGATFKPIGIEVNDDAADFRNGTGGRSHGH